LFVFLLNMHRISSSSSVHGQYTEENGRFMLCGMKLESNDDLCLWFNGKSSKIVPRRSSVSNLQIILLLSDPQITKVSIHCLLYFDDKFPSFLFRIKFLFISAFYRSKFQRHAWFLLGFWPNRLVSLGLLIS
jgi:hypothetical protein